MNPQLSIVLPCYNECGNIEEILRRFKTLAAKIDLELILVDNGSTDGTTELLNKLLSSAENAFAKSVRVEVNIGYGHGLQKGLEVAQAQTVALSHADLQCPPDDVLKAYELYKLEKMAGPCLVMGRRGGRPMADRFVTSCYNHMAASLLDFRTTLGQAPDINAQPKIFDRTLISGLLEGPKDFTFDLFVLFSAVKSKHRLVEFDVDYLTRSWGKSKLAANPWMRIKTAVFALRRILSLCQS